jgi:hypothetical protein
MAFTMSMGTDTETVIRRFEAEVLDVHHQTLSLWSYPKDKALYGLMAAFDSMLLPMAQILDETTSLAVGSRQHLKLIHEGFNQGLRWITLQEAAFPNPTPDRRLLDSGGEFILFAANYVTIANMHILYSRGLVKAEASAVDRRVRFDHSESDSASKPWFNLAEMGEAGVKENRTDVAVREQVAQSAYYSISGIPVEMLEGRLHFPDPKRLITPELLSLAELANVPEQLALDTEVSLSGFSMGEFRRFWHVILAWSLGASMIYRGLAEERKPQELCMATQIVNLDRFTRCVQELSGLKEVMIRKIIDRLCYRSTPKSDAFLQPLLCSNDLIAWCPLAIQLSKPERNMLKLMARSSGHLPDIAANIIGSREQEMLGQFGQFLAKRAQYDFKLNQGIRVGEEEAEVDMLAYRKKASREVLLVEGKTLLAVDDIGEVLTASEEIQKAQKQLYRSRDLLQKLPLAKKTEIYPFVDWPNVDTFRLLVITPESYPSRFVDQKEVPVITLQAVKTRIKNRDLQSPTTFWATCRDKQWLSNLIPDKQGFEELVVGDVIYEVPFWGELTPSIEP